VPSASGGMHGAYATRSCSDVCEPWNFDMSDAPLTPEIEPLSVYCHIVQESHPFGMGGSAEYLRVNQGYRND
jgi:hypothetical protein